MMSYQVLARKWRPKRFAELVGQEHVVRALTHALTTQRIHHAFLFTGTRGIGKTTIARIFAKSLNCEHGVSAEPCGICAICLDVDAGRFLDLLEIDAASHTGVDDIREVIENAQYKPARGQYKVYLIDEVHMLSKNAFNALLKTLEEPPEHAKFLLATTDPQKLPITVLSRCLQFNLKRLSIEQIANQIEKILSTEAVTYDLDAVAEIARAGNGSLRDALSLLDQAIAYGGGQLRGVDVRSMLGTVDHSRVTEIVDAIVKRDASALYLCINTIAELAPDFSSVLDALATLLHQIQLRQHIAEYGEQSADVATWSHFAEHISAEELQLLYQIAITGRRDMPMAPGPRIGFEMTLLRMLAFRPLNNENMRHPPNRMISSTPTPLTATNSSAPSKTAPYTEQAKTEAEKNALITAPTIKPHTEARVPEPSLFNPAITPTLISDSQAKPFDLLLWGSLVTELSLRGPIRELANHVVPLELTQNKLRLGLDPNHDHLRNEGLVKQLADVLEPKLGRIKITIESVKSTDNTVAAKMQHENNQRQAKAEASIESDALFQELIQQFDAHVIPDSTRPLG
jgi:DNA polymerase-3 subunit gamma/tau